MKPTQIQLLSFLILLSVLCASKSVYATTKGLNQIVTPDTQPEGQLSISLQQQDPTIGNRNELQVELGVTKNLEFAAFQGFSPNEQILNSELGLYSNGSYLLSTGFLNWSTKGIAPQPFLEGGYYHNATELIGGAEYAEVQSVGQSGATSQTHQTQTVLGAAYRVGSHLLTQVDYQSGTSNFSTAGFTYSLTPALNINPALYVSNSSPRKGYGYVVLTWTVQAFAPTASKSAPAAIPPISTQKTGTDSSGKS